MLKLKMGHHKTFVFHGEAGCAPFSLSVLLKYRKTIWISAQSVNENLPGTRRSDCYAFVFFPHPISSLHCFLLVLHSLPHWRILMEYQVALRPIFQDLNSLVCRCVCARKRELKAGKERVGIAEVINNMQTPTPLGTFGVCASRRLRKVTWSPPMPL